MTLKRPELSESEAAKRARADRIRVGIEECRTRLESIELLLTDSPADALELARRLPGDLHGLFVAIRGEPAQGDTTTDDETMRQLEEIGAGLRSMHDKEFDRDALDAAVADLKAGLRLALRRFHQLRGGELSTSLDHYRRRLRWLALGTVAIVVAGTTTGLWLRSTYQKEVAITYEELYRRGYQLAKGEEHDRAIEAYREAIAVLPDDSRTADSYNNLGWSLQKLERYTQARRAYESALRLRPDYTLARNNLKALRRYLE